MALEKSNQRPQLLARQGERLEAPCTFVVRIMALPLVPGAVINGKAGVHDLINSNLLSVAQILTKLKTI